MFVSCPLPPGAPAPPPPGAGLTCRFPCGATSPGRWEGERVTCALPPGVDAAAAATVEVATPATPPPGAAPSVACCGGRPCGPGTVITAPAAAEPPAWMARACVDGLPRAALAGKAAWVRSDLNAPLTADGSVADGSRLAAAVPTIAYLLQAGARVVAVASHLGRPAGPEPALSLRAVAPAFEAALRAGGLPGAAVTFVPASTGPAVAAAVRDAPPGAVLLLENVRFHGDAETGADQSALAAALAPAALFDVVVNDAFGAAHRAHASTAGVAAAARASGRPAVAGLLMRAELAALGRTLCCPARPLVAVVGGAKLSTKARIIARLVGHADAVVLGGALATTFLAALAGGGDGGAAAVGGGVEPAEFPAARAAAAAAAAAGTRLILPADVVAAPRTADGGGWDVARALVVPATAVPPGFTALDAGPATVAALSALAATAGTVVWNGPFGLAEHPAFGAGTAGIAAALAPLAAARGTTTIVGGGHSVAAVAAAGLLPSAFSHVSTGGGATLELLEGVVLPGVAALDAGPGLAGVCD